MMRYIVQWNYGTVLLCCFLLVFIFIDKSFSRSVSRHFLVAIGLVLLLCFADSIDYYAEVRFDTPQLLRGIATAVGYSCRPIVAYCIAMITWRNQRQCAFWLFLLPLCLNAAVALVSIYTGWMFTFDAHNRFVRGILGFLPFVVSGFYVSFVMLKSILVFRRRNPGEMTVILAMGATVVLAVVLESVLQYKFLLNMTMAVGVIFYYMFLLVQLYKRDALTGLFNRRKFFVDAENYRNRSMVVLSLDLNALKLINDTQGHQAGDRALVAVSEAMIKAFSKCCLYRTGGDEFMILSMRESLSSVEKMVEHFFRILAKTPYSAAVGYAEYTPGMNFDRVCYEADERMYASKHGRQGEAKPGFRLESRQPPADADLE